MFPVDELRLGFRLLSLNRARKAPPGQVARRQGHRLRRLVRWARERSPFYREKYARVDPDRFGLADLPVTTKAELMAHFDRAVTDPSVRRAELEAFLDDPANLGRHFLGRYAVSHTSGSQG